MDCAYSTYSNTNLCSRPQLCEQTPPSGESSRKDHNNFRNRNLLTFLNDLSKTSQVFTALLVLPTLHNSYTYLTFYFLGEPWAILYFFFAPFAFFYSISVGENMIRLFRSLKPLAIMLFQPHKVYELTDLRERCVLQTCRAVDEIGWGLKMQFSREEVGSRFGSPSVRERASGAGERGQASPASPGDTAADGGGTEHGGERGDRGTTEERRPREISKTDSKGSAWSGIGDGGIRVEEARDSGEESRLTEGEHRAAALESPREESPLRGGTSDTLSGQDGGEVVGCVDRPTRVGFVSGR